MRCRNKHLHTVKNIFLTNVYIYFFHKLIANLGLVLLIYLYSIHREICRSSDHSVVRSRAEIQPRTGGSSGRETNH